MHRHQLLHELDRVLNKSSKAVNKPYQAIKRTDEYKNVKSQFTEGIVEQANWAAENVTKLLDGAGVRDAAAPLTLDQEQKLKSLIKRDMPAISEYVSERKLFQNLKGFFEWSVKQQYKRWGYMVKSAVEFSLTNQQYIDALKDRSQYLLNRSSLDDTTLDGIFTTFRDARLEAKTNSEVAQMLRDNFDEISDSRGEMIARTESANAMGDANYAAAKENGAATHYWVVAGPGCDYCDPNEDDGEIPIDEPFSSGDLSEPAHPNCECYTQAGEIDLDSIDIWSGG